MRYDGGQNALERWWTQKHGRPGSHPLFLAQTEAGLTLEWLEDLHRRRDELLDAIRDRVGDFNKNVESLDAINRILEGQTRETRPDGAVLTGDPLADEWERALAEGRMPDLDAGLRREGKSWPKDAM